MLRVLLASNDEVLVKEVAYQLRDACMLEACRSGDRALELLFDFDPDVLLIDMRLPGTDSLTVIRTVRTTGRNVGIIAMSALINDYVYSQLENLNVNCLLPKPCRVGTVVSHIRDLCFCIQHPDSQQWSLERELDHILLDLGFRMGSERYESVRCAVLTKYYAHEGVLMKDIYYGVVKARGGNSSQAEKAIRDSIKAAWNRGIPYLWKLYFRPGRDGLAYCPTNDEFVTRIANCLQHRDRIKKPYEAYTQKAM